MIRLSALLWLMLVVAAGFVTFKVKYAVQDIDDELSRVRKQTIAEQQEIRVLSAEWTYLNQPERLAELNRRFLQLAPIGAKQLQHKIEDIPLRPMPPPSAPPDMLVAAVPDPPALPASAPVAPSNEDAQTPSPAASAAPGARSGLAAFAIAQASASELSVASAALKPASPSSGAKVQLAKARPMSTPNSLDELFSQVAETR